MTPMRLSAHTLGAGDRRLQAKHGRRHADCLVVRCTWGLVSRYTLTLASFQRCHPPPLRGTCQRRGANHQQDLAVYMGPTNVLNELGPDISAVEFRKDKHICLPANRAWSHLALSDLGYECRVSLHLAVHSDFHPEPVRERAQWRPRVPPFRWMGFSRCPWWKSLAWQCVGAFRRPAAPRGQSAPRWRQAARRSDRARHRNRRGTGRRRRLSSYQEPRPQGSPK